MTPRPARSLWTFQAGAGVNAPPSSYSDRQQAVRGGRAAGGNVQLDYKRGNAIIAFTLD